MTETESDIEDQNMPNILADYPAGDNEVAFVKGYSDNDTEDSDNYEDLYMSERNAQYQFRRHAKRYKNAEIYDAEKEEEEEESENFSEDEEEEEREAESIDLEDTAEIEMQDYEIQGSDKEDFTPAEFLSENDSEDDINSDIEQDDEDEKDSSDK